jgi:hypothetical protein
MLQTGGMRQGIVHVKMKDFCTLNTTYSLQKQSSFATKLQEHYQEDQSTELGIRGRQVGSHLVYVNKQTSLAIFSCHYR